MELKSQEDDIQLPWIESIFEYRDTATNPIFLVFHLTHCVTACAAPKLWRELK